MKRRELAAWALISIMAVAGFVLACERPAAAVPGRTSGVLVYICQTAPCKNAQILQVNDQYGNPGFGVPEYGGPWSAGDCGLRDFSTDPKRFLDGKPSMTICYETPQAYASQHPTSGVLACVAPARWDWPGGTDVCVSGAWVRKVTL